MKKLQILLILAGVFQVSIQQSLRCFTCVNCGANSDWERTSCLTGEEDGPSGPPTNPPSPLGYLSPKNISTNSTVDFPAVPLSSTSQPWTPQVENTNLGHVCFTIVVNVLGQQQTNRGCTPRRSDNRECEFINNQVVTDCQLCSTDLCNSGSGQLVYSLLLVAAFYLFWNILS